MSMLPGTVHAQQNPVWFPFNGKTLDKPLVMTEGPALIQRHLAEYLNGAFDGGWTGSLPWSYYRLIGLSDLKRYPQIVTSNVNKPQAAANIDLYRAFNRSHAAAVKLGM
jgi:hypothetical protein